MRGPCPQDFTATFWIWIYGNDLKAFNWEEVLIFLVFSFWHILVSCIKLSHFHLLPFKYIYGAKCLIYIHLCTFHVKENSARLQWYSCARYKAPGPLVIFNSYVHTYAAHGKTDCMWKVNYDWGSLFSFSLENKML